MDEAGQAAANKLTEGISMQCYQWAIPPRGDVYEQNEHFSQQEKVNIRHVRSQDFVHLEHVDFICIKDGSQAIVTYNFPFVTRVLQVVRFDIDPELLDDLWPR